MYPSSPLHPTDPLEKAMGRLLVGKFDKMIKPYYGVMLAKGDTAEELKKCI